MPKPVTIVPSVLARDVNIFRKQWQKIAPFFNYIQIDIMDGRMVKTKNNIRPSCLRPFLKKESLEIHLMTQNPWRRIRAWSQVKNVCKIIWHYEAVPNLQENKKIINFLENKKIKSGLALNPETKVKSVLSLIPYFDTIQIMGVHPGRQGQKFLAGSLLKIKTLRRLFPRLNISIDGGVNDKNFAKIKKAGANFIGLGSYLQKTPRLSAALQKLKA